MLIWTRSADDWERDQALFQGQQDRLLRLPCIKIHSLSETDVNRQLPPDLPGRKNTVTVFSSAHGAGYFLSLRKIRAIVEASLNCYAIGPVTQKVLEENNIRAQVPDGVTKAKELSEWLRHEYAGQDISFFLPGGRLRAFNLEGALREGGFQAINLNLYETRSGCWGISGPELDLEGRKKLLPVFRQGVICFASPSAVRGFARSFEFAGSDLSRWKVVAIGSSTGATCQEFFTRVRLASEPTTEHLKNTAEIFLKS